MEKEYSTMFEKVSRKKLRFVSPKGIMNVEDLWDITLTDLNKMAVGLYKKVKEQGDINFLKTKPMSSSNDMLQFNIIKHIIDTRIEEKTKSLEKSKLKERKQVIMGIINEKENETLKNSTIEDLKKELAGL